jgi:hypothetical protein
MNDHEKALTDAAAAAHAKKTEAAESKVALVVGEEVKIFRSETEEQLSAKLYRFMTVVVISGLLLAIALGYESLETRIAVNEVRAAAKDVETIRSDRAVIIAAQRVSACSYTKQFVATFKSWAKTLAAADTIELTHGQNIIYHQQRLQAYKVLFAQLDAAGTSACVTPGSNP